MKRQALRSRAAVGWGRLPLNLAGPSSERRKHAMGQALCSSNLPLRRLSTDPTGSTSPVIPRCQVRSDTSLPRAA